MNPRLGRSQSLKERISMDEDNMSSFRKTASISEELTHEKMYPDEEKTPETRHEMKHRKKKALLELRCKVEDAILGNYLLDKQPKQNLTKQEKKSSREISLWGVPLLSSQGHEGTEIILMKFLKAKEFKVDDAFEMLRETLKWRKEFKADGILEEDFVELAGVENGVRVSSVDREGRPLYYNNAYGAFRDKILYRKVLGSEENREKYLRWRIQSIERGITHLSFKGGGVHSMVHITDLKNSVGPDMKELRSVSKKALKVVQANYPEIIHKNILVNVPFWFYTSHYVMSKILNQRFKNKFILVRSSKVTKTLVKYISPEHLYVEYGGLKRENDAEFTTEDKAIELPIRPNSCGTINIPVSEGGVTVVWDFVVVGWEVGYKEEFIPDDEGSYRILVRHEKEKKTGESCRNSFYISEPGKILITIDNPSLKTKSVYYRSKAKPTIPSYISFHKK